MGGSEEWAPIIKAVGAAFGVFIVAMWGVIAGKRNASSPRAIEGEVVAATFTERALMQRLTAALEAVHVELVRMNARAADEAHDREIAKAVSDAFEKRKVRE